MSITRPTGLPEHTVENRSEYAKNLHRPHGAHDEPVPACEERNRPEADFRLVRTEQMLGFRTPCQNPACFGEGPVDECNGDGDSDGRADEDACPSCGGPERRREVTESGQAVIAPCGCEVSLQPMTDGGERTIEACPECDYHEINRRVPTSALSPHPSSAAKYRCCNCGAEFDRPAERPPKNPNWGLHEALDEADQDAVPDGGVRFQTTDNVQVTDHARERWRERAGISCDVDDAWRDAIPIDHVSAPLHSGLYARYHRRGDVVLLAHRATVLTVLERRQPPQGRPGNKPGGVTL